MTALTTSLPVIPPARVRRSCTFDDLPQPAPSDGRHVRTENLGGSPESSERIPSDTKEIECLRRSSEAPVRFALARFQRAQASIAPSFQADDEVFGATVPPPWMARRLGSRRKRSGLEPATAHRRRRTGCVGCGSNRWDDLRTQALACPNRRMPCPERAEAVAASAGGRRRTVGDEMALGTRSGTSPALGRGLRWASLQVRSRLHPRSRRTGQRAFGPGSSDLAEATLR